MKQSIEGEKTVSKQSTIIWEFNLKNMNSIKVIQSMPTDLYINSYRFQFTWCNNKFIFIFIQYIQYANNYRINEADGNNTSILYNYQHIYSDWKIHFSKNSILKERNSETNSAFFSCRLALKLFIAFYRCAFGELV